MTCQRYEEKACKFWRLEKNFVHLYLFILGIRACPKGVQSELKGFINLRGSIFITFICEMLFSFSHSPIYLKTGSVWHVELQDGDFEMWLGIRQSLYCLISIYFPISHKVLYCWWCRLIDQFGGAYM